MTGRFSGRFTIWPCLSASLGDFARPLAGSGRVGQGGLAALSLVQSAGALPRAVNEAFRRTVRHLPIFRVRKASLVQTVPLSSPSPRLADAQLALFIVVVRVIGAGGFIFRRWHRFRRAQRDGSRVAIGKAVGQTVAGRDLRGQLRRRIGDAQIQRVLGGGHTPIVVRIVFHVDLVVDRRVVRIVFAIRICRVNV